MPIDYEKLIHSEIPEVEQTLTKRDTMLYALGVGLGADPCDPGQLKFVYEKNLQALPTMAIILGYPGPWYVRVDAGITRTHVVHGEQGFTIHRPLPVEGTIAGRTTITGVIDKGKDKGAIVLLETKVRDKTSGELICTLTSTGFCRADGGFGGPKRATPAPHAVPERAPDLTCDLPTRPEMALIYRLSGDVNPLHAEPEFAKAAGFPRPILHGLATFGVAGHALIKSLCGYDPARLTGMAGRFSAPVYPGETVRTEIWRDGGVTSFRARVVERDAVAINNGRADIVV